MQKVIDFIKPNSIAQAAVWLLVTAMAFVLYPEVKNLLQYNDHLTQQQIIDTEMTKRWMLLPQDQTHAVSFTTKTGTQFIVRVYPDDSLLVTNGTTIRWLPSAKALAAIEAKRPSNRWVLDWFRGAALPKLIPVAYAGVPYVDSHKVQESAVEFTFTREWKDGSERIEDCIWNTKEGVTVCIDRKVVFEDPPEAKEDYGEEEAASDDPS